ncbi:MAG: ATP-grasp domain-containing protein [Hyphomicrobium sp.]
MQPDFLYQESPHGLILIAAFSGRALAQSARRAGYKPLVVDCFGDQDTKNLAYSLCCLPARVQVGFRKRPLLEALQNLSLLTPDKPIGLILGTGFECNPRLVEALSKNFSLLGNKPNTIRRVKDPIEFFGTLKRLGIRHPQTQVHAPETPEGWLMKRIGGSGGLHVHVCPKEFHLDKRRYFQKWERGHSLSVFAIASKKGSAFAFSEQWTSPTKRRPYRYGGSVSGITLHPDLEARLIEACMAVISEFNLEGIISLDFIVQEDEFLLLEVNPRPGATLDIFEDTEGTLFSAHLLSLSGHDPTPHLKKNWAPKKAVAAAYLYADRGALSVPKMEWPLWTADRPCIGITLERGQPIATVLAEGLTTHEAKKLCLERLDLLDRTLYETSKKDKN